MPSLLTAFPRTAGLHSSMELVEHCGQGQYTHSNRPALPTTLAPFVETGAMALKFSELRNIEREVTSDKQVAALTIPPLCQHLLPRGGRAKSSRTFRWPVLSRNCHERAERAVVLPRGYRSQLKRMPIGEDGPWSDISKPLFSDPQAPERMTAQDRATAPCGSPRLTTRVHRRGALSLLPARATSLQPSMEIAKHCCQGRYYHRIPTVLPTTTVPVIGKGGMALKFSAFRNIERGATSGKQLAALTIPPLHQHLLQRGEMAESWRAFG
ncbi:hypothetical protein MTO96_021753 [Rhipicephalus appendiculatus]